MESGVVKLMRFNYSQLSPKDESENTHFNNCGLTLVEVIIASSMSVVIIAVSFIVFISSIGLYQRGYRKAAVEQNAQLQAERLSRELRQAKKIIQITESGIYPFYTKIKFTTLEDKEISYVYDANLKYLICQEFGVKDKIIARIFQTHDDISFIGYKENNDTTTDPQLVRAVRMTLKVTDDKNENTSSLRTMIFLRN